MEHKPKITAQQQSGGAGVNGVEMEKKGRCLQQL